MITASELRVGNLFQDTDGTYCYYAGSWQRSDGWINRDSANNTYKESEMHPIPLTPEILEKCGFVVNSGMHGYKYYYPNEDALWSIRQEGDRMWQVCIIVRYDEIWKFNPIVNYLHQLQNLYYALTGEELNVQL